jgi:hypothetical protein
MFLENCNISEISIISVKDAPSYYGVEGKFLKEFKGSHSNNLIGHIGFFFTPSLQAYSIDPYIYLYTFFHINAMAYNPCLSIETRVQQLHP